MADSSTGLFSFLAGAPSTSALSYPAMEARRKIALQMMANSRRGFPKTLGEGLTTIGDAIGDIGVMRGLSAQEAAFQKQAGVNAESAIPAEARTPAVTPGPQASTDTETAKPEVLAYARPDDSAPPAEPAAQPATASLPPEVEPGVSGPGFNPLDAAGAADPWTARRNAIAGIESGDEKDPYRTLGTTNTHSGDRAYGKYQIMGANIPSWTQAATGTALTPQQFLASPAAQEATFQHRFGQYVDKYGDEGAARAWYAGEHGMNKLDATDLHERLSVRDYGRDFMNRMAPYNRDRVAATITPQTEQPSAALPLTAPDAAQSGLPPEITQGFSAKAPQQPQIPTAPPQQSIRQAPPVQIAQAAPPAREPLPTLTPMGEDEKRGYQIRAKERAMGIPAEMQQGQALIDYGEKNRAQRDAVIVKNWQDQILQQREIEKFNREGGAASVQQKQAAASLEAGKAALASRLGGGVDPQAWLNDFAKNRDATEQAVNVLRQSKLAKQALNEGIVSGSGADFRVNMEKLKAMFGNESAAQLAARSEQFLAAVKSTLNNAVQNIQGKDPKVTDSDVKVASGTIGADLNLQNATLHKLVDQTIQSQHQRINKYEDLKDYYLGGTKNEKMYDVRTDQTASKPYVDRLLENKNEPDALRQFDLKFGPGAAELEIARANRRARHPQSGGE